MLKSLKTVIAVLALFCAAAQIQAGQFITPEVSAAAVSALNAKFPAQSERIAGGVNQVAAVWTENDGTPQEFSDFCLANFMEGAELDAAFDNVESRFEYIDGYFTAMRMQTGRAMDVNTGPLRPQDRLFAAFSPSAHLQEDMFSTKLAFFALLNFPVKTLEQTVTDGQNWTRRQWAQARLTKRFAYRVPASVTQRIVQSLAQAEEYIAGYNIYMDRISGADGSPVFPNGPVLQSHWGLRDELKAYYAKPADGLAKQQLIYTIMRRIIAQEIPAEVINSSAAFWNPESNTVNGSAAAPEADVRYQKWLDVFNAVRLEDPYYPDYPAYSDRIFSLEREVKEAQAQVLFEQLLDVKAAAAVGAVIEKRLGRKLQPFDIWYDGFKSRSAVPQEKLDAICREKYPSVESFQKGIPDILVKLGFTREKADFVAPKIEVEDCRGGGHASPANMRGEKSHLCVRFNKDGLDYQGFNTAMHELGHATEQTFSLYEADHHFLRGVPVSAITEGFAFMFQDRDMFVLGLDNSGADADAMKTLDSYWSAREIAGVALVDMQAWRWLDSHPKATPAEFKDAVSDIAKTVWNKYYAPVFGVSDSPLLAIYSHMVNYPLYIPDYPLGHIIAYQLEDYLKTRPLATEMERMCKIGSVIPQEWMRQAVGADISAQPIVDGALKAVKKIK